MSTTTTNYGLIKPDTTDPILIEQLNNNADAIDAALKENADAIENKPDAADIPSPSTAAPAMDGTAAAGTSTDYARADHVHPSDTSKQDALTTAQLAAVNSGIDSAKVSQIETNKTNISSYIGLGTEIVANSDLDSLNAIGAYYSAGATIGTTLINCPTIQPFRLIVDYWQGSANRIQRIISVEDTSTFKPVCFVRVKSSTGYKPWIKIDGTIVS